VRGRHSLVGVEEERNRVVVLHGLGRQEEGIDLVEGLRRGQREVGIVLEVDSLDYILLGADILVAGEEDTLRNHFVQEEGLRTPVAVGDSPVEKEPRSLLGEDTPVEDPDYSTTFSRLSED